MDMASYSEFFDGQFSSDLDIDYEGPTLKTLVIASTPRCGSHMLGQTLQKTEQFGDPLEYMQPTHIERWKRKYSADHAPAALRAIMDHRTSRNGVFSIKLHYSHLRALGGIAKLRELFPDPRFVLLRRRDTLRQAVSHAVAHQSGVWFGDTADRDELDYAPDLINWALTVAIRDTANWRYDILRSGLPLLELDSEDVLADVPTAVQRVARLLDVDVPDVHVPRTPATRKQASSVNDEWMRRFLTESSLPPAVGLPGSFGHPMTKLAKRILRTVGLRS